MKTVDERQRLLEVMRYWPPELRHPAVLTFCESHRLAIDYRWERYDGGWFSVMIERMLVVPDDPALNVGTGEVRRVSRREWRQMREIPKATALRQ
jgi:hypothetical protein